MQFLTLFIKVTICFKYSILIICHGGHFSFSKLSLNVAQYTLSAISVSSNFTPINLRFSRFLLWFDFLKLYLEKKINKASFPKRQKTLFFQTNQFWILVNFQVNQKVNFFRKVTFPELLSLYEMSVKWGNGFGHFSAFLNFGPFFWRFLGTAVKNAKHEKVV